jgi:hypothetical protein
MADLNKTMDAVAELHKSHGVKQKGGKLYTQVVHRMEAFRKHHGTDFGVDTSILVNDGKKVVVKAIITDKDGRTVGAGMAEEIRGQGYFELGDKRNINTTSALENAETSAIGRALSSLGLAGGEYASANEMDAVVRKTKALEETPPKEVKEQEIDPAPQTDQSPAQYSLEESQAAHSRLSSAIANSESIKYNSDAEKGRIIYLQGIFRENQQVLKKMTDEHRSDIQKQFVDMETKLKKIFDQTQLGRS